MIKVFHQPENSALFGSFGRTYDLAAARHIANHLHEFKHVADVATDDLEEAYRLTNHIDAIAPSESAWYLNNTEQVTFLGSNEFEMNGCRSSFIGDVFYRTVDNTFFYLRESGTERIDVGALIHDVLQNGVISSTTGKVMGGKITAIKYKRAFTYAAGNSMSLKDAKDWIENYMALNGFHNTPIPLARDTTPDRETLKTVMEKLEAIYAGTDDTPTTKFLAWQAMAALRPYIK